MRYAVAAVAFVAVALSARAEDRPVIDLELPLHVHLVRSIEILRHDVAMQTWMARRFDPEPDRYHLFVLPYIGATMQGEAFFRPKFAFLGAWTDKPSKGFGAPQKVKLTEPEPLRVGSLGRTAAHELGHLLGLKHDDCSRHCLMGGTRGDEGYLLTLSEIAAARGQAQAFVNLRK